MNRNETIDVLTAIAAYDQRTIGDADIAAWHMAIEELDRQLALEAVVIHHKTSAERCKPIHVLTVAKQIRKDRAERESRLDRERREDERDRRNGLTPVDSQIGLPIGNVDGKPIWSAYEQHGAIELPCLTCNSKPNESCTNTSTGQNRKIPCASRLIAGRKRAAERNGG